MISCAIRKGGKTAVMINVTINLRISIDFANKFIKKGTNNELVYN